MTWREGHITTTNGDWQITASPSSSLRVTVSAGQFMPERAAPDEIRVAIQELKAERIGHGTTLLDDPSVAELVRESAVTIEACPTSNVHTGVIPSVAAHPIGRWLDMGIKACINTDNTLLSDTTMSKELERTIPGGALRASQREAVIENGHDGCFSRTKALLTGPS